MVVGGHGHLGIPVQQPVGVVSKIVNVFVIVHHPNTVAKTVLVMERQLSCATSKLVLLVSLHAIHMLIHKEAPLSM